MHIRNPGKRHIGWFDVHVPNNIDLKKPLGFAHDHGCDNFIVGGDFLDLQWASHWNERLFKEVGNLKLREWVEKELSAGEKVFSEIRRAVGKKAKIWYIPGNHEAWLWYACFYHQFLAVPWRPEDVTFKSDVSDLLNKGLALLLKTHLHADKYGVHVLDYYEPLRIGKIVYLHGHQFGGSNPTNASTKRWPHVNLVMGHHHSHEVKTIYNSADPKEVFQHVVVPCMTRLGPGYLRDKSTRWLNGFWVADHLSNGLFDGRVRKILGGKMIP